MYFLIARRRLSAPLLYLSSCLERDRQRYYDALQAVRERGDIVPWVDLFLTAVQTQVSDAVTRAERIVQLRESYREAAASIGTANGLALVDLICENPLVTTRLVEERLGAGADGGGNRRESSMSEWDEVVLNDGAGPAKWSGTAICAVLVRFEVSPTGAPATSPAGRPPRKPRRAARARL